MSAQTSDPQTNVNLLKCLFIIIPALFGLLGKLLVPVMERFLSHRSISRKRSKRIDVKLTMVEKLLSIQERCPDSPRIMDIVQLYLNDIFQSFESLMPIETRWPLVPGKGLPCWRRFLLMYKQPSLKGKVYKFFFYVFLCAALIGGTVSVYINPRENWFFAVMGGAFYLILSLLLRAAAVQSYKKVAENLAANKSDTSG